MGKTRRIQLFGRILEFKLKKKENEARLKLLVDTLYRELKAQGYDTESSDRLKESLFIFCHKDSYDLDVGIKASIKIKYEGETEK